MAASPAIANPLLRYWHGRGRLAPLYWGWGVAGSVVLALLVAGPPLLGLAGLGWALAGIALGAAYTVWILVSIWRCAENIETPAPLGISREALAWMARWLTIGWAINAAGMSVLLQALLFGPPLR
jgi:hypothetical protein